MGPIVESILDVRPFFPTMPLCRRNTLVINGGKITVLCRGLEYIGE